MTRLLAFVCRYFVISGPFCLRLVVTSIIAIAMTGCTKSPDSSVFSKPVFSKPVFSKVASYTQPNSQSSEQFDMAFSPDGEQLAIISSDTSVVINIQQRTDNQQRTALNQFTPDKAEDIEHFAFSTESQNVLDYQSGPSGKANMAIVRDSQSGEEIWRIDRLVSPDSVAISADGQRVATIRDVFGEGAVFTQPLSIWDVSTGEEIAQFESDDECVFGWGNDLSLSSGGDRLATQCFGTAGKGAIAIFDIASGTRTLFPAEVSARRDFGLSPSGQQLAIRRVVEGEANTTVEVWDLP